MRGKIADVITHVKFYVNRFWCFGAVTPQNLGISIGMAGGSYNSVSTAVLHCEVTLSGYIQTCQRMQGTTCVDLQHRDPLQSKEYAAHTLCRENSKTRLLDCRVCHKTAVKESITSGSAMAEGPRDALVSRNYATTKHPI